MKMTERLGQTLKRLFHAIGRLQSAIVFSVFYALCWVPVGLVTRLVADWLRFREPGDSNWSPRATRVNDPRHITDPF